jgi:hypothetical protein
MNQGFPNKRAFFPICFWNRFKGAEVDGTDLFTSAEVYGANLMARSLQLLALETWGRSLFVRRN